MNKIPIKLDTFDKIKSFAKDIVKFESDVNLYKGSQTFDAKSILSIVVLLDLSNEVEVQIISSKEDEIVKFIKTMSKYESR